MHDVAKPSIPDREKKVARRKLRGWIYIVGAVLCLFGVVAALKALGAAILILLVVVATLLAGLFGLIAVNRFRSKRTTAGAVFAVLFLFLALVDVKLLQFLKMNSSPMVMPATTVTSAVAKEEDWAPALSSVGTISAVQGAVVSSELGGTVAEVKFQNGGVAKKGDILVRLAATSEDADLELARSDLMRTRDLAARKVISKAELDAAESKLKQKEGAVEKREVRAPFDGQLGIRQVNVGQMINSGQQVVSLQALGWICRAGAMYFFLRAFGIHADLSDASLALSAGSIATLLPLTPGGIGPQQALLVYMFNGVAARGAVLSFSVGMQFAITVCNAVIGGTCLALMLRRMPWKSHRPDPAVPSSTHAR